MSKEYFDELTNQLTTFIQGTNTTAYPLIGVITNATTDYQYCDVQTDQGTLSNIPAHGLPIIGDTAIIHFINGKYEMPVADCARRLPAPESDVTTYTTSECYNYLDNGDFHNTQPTNMTGNYTITNTDSYTMSENSCLLENVGDYIEVTVDISKCTNDYFKFQAMYQGNGSLSIECIDADTLETIKNLPYTCSYDYKIWTSPSRYGWRYNKEVYPRIEDNTTHKNIIIRVTNNTEEETIQIEDTTRSFNAMLVSAMLVYDENSDKEYYSSTNDVITDD